MPVKFLVSLKAGFTLYPVRAKRFNSKNVCPKGSAALVKYKYGRASSFTASVKLSNLFQDPYLRWGPWLPNLKLN